jgi:transcriptional regulator with XRE-family HTH domain
MPQEFPERLRKAREAKDLSQTDLATRSGLEPSAISHFETGRRQPSFANLKRLADALAVTIDYLVGRADEPRGSGPAAEQLFRDFERLSSEDQETLTGLARMLAKKNDERQGRGGS